MKKNLLLVITSLCSFCSFAQSYTWASAFGSADHDYAADIATSAAGSSYITGYFSDTLHFASMLIPSNNAPSSANPDIYLVKYDGSGSPVWAQKAGGMAFDMGMAVAADAADNAYITGYFRDTAMFGSISAYAPQQNVFIAKYDPSGTTLWLAQAVSSNEAVGTAVAVDNAGNVIIGGYFKGNLSFGTPFLTGDLTRDIFLAKYTPAGTLVWTTSVSGGAGDAFVRDISLDAAGNVYVTGEFDGDMQFVSGTLTNSSPGNTDVYVAKFDAMGTEQWAVRAGGAGSDYANGIAADAAGNAYVTGSFLYSAMFGSTSLTSMGQDDIFLAKLNTTGAFAWVQQAGGAMGDAGDDVVLDQAGNLMLAGSFNSGGAAGDSAMFDSLTIYGPGMVDAFAASYDAMGNARWAIAGGGAGIDQATGITSPVADAAIITGTFENTATFGANTFTTVGNNAQEDVFIARVDNIAIGIGSTFHPQVAVRPNPAHNSIRVSGVEEGSAIRILNELSQVVSVATVNASETIIDTAHLPAGMYYIEITCGQNRSVRKMIIQ